MSDNHPLDVDNPETSFQEAATCPVCDSPNRAIRETVNLDQFNATFVCPDKWHDVSAL